MDDANFAGIESRYCLDGENWSLGKFSLYQLASSSKQRFRNCAATESLHEQDKEIFQLIGDFNQSNHNWVRTTYVYLPYDVHIMHK